MILFLLFLFCANVALLTAESPQVQEPGLLFYLSGDYALQADYAAGGEPRPNFQENVRVIADGAIGPGIECGHKQLLSYWAPGNIYAERGTLSFFWRSREPVGKTEFPLFRVAYADHSSWDMVWLRIDYNGHGFDAFVTDSGLARIRVSYTLDPFPGPKEWIHLALTWDETSGIRFYVNGNKVAQENKQAVLSAGLDQFGPHSRIISPFQVQSAYNYVRGGDLDELRIYDRMLADEAMAQLSKGRGPGILPSLKRDLRVPRWREEWWGRYGWNHTAEIPPCLETQRVKVRKVEIQDAYDLKRWWWKATDGIRETTWPGVYNRSRLPGRNDYFQLPDWDCYSLSGKSITFLLPEEQWNHVEISGPARGEMSLVDPQDNTKTDSARVLFQRPADREKTVHRIPEAITGGKIRFTNREQEIPIEELSVYHVAEGKEPVGIRSLSYSPADPTDPAGEALQPLLTFLTGRYLPDERQILIAKPGGMGISSITEKREKVKLLPVVHLLIPYECIDTEGKGSDPSYSWEKIGGGLDGIAIDLPPMKMEPTHGEYLPMNLQVLDPLWPMRRMIDFSFSIRPNRPYTLWLDLRDRILPDKKSLCLTLSAAGGGFSAKSLQNAVIRLVFKTKEEAMPEHLQDRFTQVRDNYAHWVEERPRDARFRLYNRLTADLGDLLRLDPNHYPGRNYRYDLDPRQVKPPFQQPTAPPGVPLWAFRQTEALRAVERFILWWIDHRQIENGEFGGGLSDDDDLTNIWPAAALMGCEPEKITDSLMRLSDAFYRQGMFTNGLSTIQADGLHAHEEGIETQGQTMLVQWGNPKVVERTMETVRALEDRILVKNPAGHRHFRSNYFSGSKIAAEGVWEWPQAQVFLLMQPILTLVRFNGNPRACQLAIETADGLLAHSRRDDRGRILVDTEIHFSTDASRPSPLGSPSVLASSMGSEGSLNTSSSGLQLLWAVYRMTGDRKYLQPLLDMGEGVLGSIAENALDIAGLRESFGRRIVEQIQPGDANPFFRHIAWQMTGDKTFLENYYADQIEWSSLRGFINTEGSLWTDRVYVPTRELQRSRLGGIALVRGANYSGHAVSWQFHPPAKADDLAILIPRATPESIRIIAYNLKSEPVRANLTLWNILPGEWQIHQRTEIDGDDSADGNSGKEKVPLRPSRSILREFPSRKTVILELRRQPGPASSAPLPDWGIGKDDIALQGKTIRVRMHSLGSAEAPAAMVSLVQDGKTIAIARVSPLPAPLDLLPKTVDITLIVADGTDLPKCKVIIDPDRTLDEITRQNNEISLKEILPVDSSGRACFP